MVEPNEGEKCFFIVNSFILCMDWFCLNVAGESKTRLNHNDFYVYDLKANSYNNKANFERKTQSKKLSNKNKWIVVHQFNYHNVSCCFFISFVCVYSPHHFHASHKFNSIPRTHVYVCERVRVTMLNAIASIQSQLNSTAAFNNFKIGCTSAYETISAGIELGSVN